MQPGTPVEINSIVAYAFPEPIRAWSGGYEFVRQENERNVIVKHTSGMYQGIEVRYPINDVRSAI